MVLKVQLARYLRIYKVHIIYAAVKSFHVSKQALVWEKKCMMLK